MLNAKYGAFIRSVAVIIKYSIRLFGQTYTYNGLIQQKCTYRIEVTNSYNVS